MDKNTEKINFILSEVNKTEDYERKTQVVQVLTVSLQNKSIKATAYAKEALSAFVAVELEKAVTLLPRTESYREKSKIFAFADILFGVIMLLFRSPQELPADKLEKLKNAAQVITEERSFEHSIDNIFEQDIVSKNDVDTLLEELAKTKDEYKKGLFYIGVLHYSDKLNKLLETSKAAVSEYVGSELCRYINEYPAADEEKLNAMKAACDMCRHFINEDITASLRKIIALGNIELTFYAVQTLVFAGKEVDAQTVALLAGDLVHADATYHFLKRYGKEVLFPAELANEIYLAKSNLVHWLTYPTELGKAPDEIEYIGKTEVKKEVFHIFRFTSDSDNLGDLKGKWLIGWANDEGDTFSEFDEYEKFDKGTPEKTLKYIKKKLL